jgi:hypothetical protein
MFVKIKSINMSVRSSLGCREDEEKCLMGVLGMCISPKKKKKKELVDTIEVLPFLCHSLGSCIAHAT